MKKTISTLFLLLFTLQMIFAQTGQTTVNNADAENSEIQKLLKSYEKKIYFTQNQGQFSQKVMYRADFPLGQAVVTKEGIIVTTYDEDMMHDRHEEGEQIEQDIKDGKPWRPISGRMKGHSWRMNFINNSPLMTIEGRQHHSDVYNYFTNGIKLGSVNNYGEIWYNNVYDKVDVRYYPSAEGELEYDIVCKPGFNKKSIAVKFDGIEKLKVLPNGHLVLQTSVGDVDVPAPIAYQKIDGAEKAVVARYALSGNEIRFDMGDYDITQPVIIDPIALRWATWVNTNSSGDNHGHCIWVDQADGAIYVVARVVGTTDQITVGAFDVSANGNLETIIGKYTEPLAIGGSGTRVWQTYIGGSGDENPYAMEQGPDSNLYITGYTSSTNFPLIGGSEFGGASIDHRTQTTDNIFIMKITRDGQSIKSSVIGGNGDDGSFDLRIDNSGDIVICGNTQSTNLLTQLPGTGAVNANNGNIDGIVFKINSDLSAVSWVKNYGGSGVDQPTIMVQNNSTGEIFVGGYTTSTNFPTTIPRQATRNGAQSGFLQKLNSAGTTLWSSYFQSATGGTASILCMEFNTTKDQLYFGGITNGLVAANIGHVGVYDSTYNAGTNDFFVCRMDTNQNYVACTYLGGSANEVNMMGLNTDLNNDVYVFGYTNSTNFPVSALPNTPLQTSNLGQNDKVFLKLNSTLSNLVFSTYYGGNNDDYDPVGERGIKFSNCRIYTIVTSISNNIPLTQGALNTSRISTTPYEPGLVVWANPPDLVNNTINDDQTICAGATPQDITGSVPNYSLPTITRNGTTSTYPALASAATYQWQMSTDSVNWSPMGGQTGQNLSGAAIGPLFVKTFFRRIIGGDACVLAGAADQVVTVKIITVTGTVNNVLCSGTGNGSITANSDGQPNFQYLWSNGQTSQTATNLTTGTYTVTVTDAGNCTATASFNITVNPSPATPTITGNLVICQGSPTILDAGAGYSGYSWSTGVTTQTISVNTAGTWTVTVTAANGCTASASATTTANTNPTPSITGTLTFCQGSSTQLCTQVFSGYSWSTGATTQCVTINTAGTWTVTVTDGNGCSGTASATTSTNSLPSSTITGSGSVCSGSSTQWCAPSGLSGYLWSTGATTQCITVASAGTFTVTVSDQNGCSSSSSKSLTVNSLPSSSITGSGFVCSGSSTQWCAPSGLAGYLWSTGATTQCITVASAGTFTVTVSDQNGCSSSSSKSLTVNSLPSSTITGSGSVCSGSSTQWCAPSGLSGYLWSTGATTQCITVASAGTFTVTVSDQNGCSSSSSKSLTVNSLPSSSITGSGSVCSGSSTQWCAPSGLAGYLWSTGATTQCITVASAGTFTVTVSDQNGCSSSSSKSLTVNSLPSSTITGSGSVCSGSSTQWCAPSGLSGYLWSTGATAQCITVASAGTFTVTVSDQNGCSSSSSKSLTVNSLPSSTITGSGSVCSGSSTQWCAPSGLSGYLWSTGATTQCITVASAGTFTVTVSDQNGCSSSSSKSLTVNSLPSSTISGNSSVCTGGSTQWCAPSGLSGYLWSTGATTQCITVSTANTFTVTVTDQSGCSSSSSKSLTVNQVANCTITGSANVCSGSLTQWCAASGQAGYLWSTGATTQCITLSNGGTYSVTTTADNGCVSNCNKTLTVRSLPSAAITGNASVCPGSSTQWCAPAGLAGYLWSTGATTQCVTVSSAGTYTVTTTNTFGCTKSSSKSLTIKSVPSSTITGTTSVCPGNSAQWCAPAGLAAYLWSTGATTQCVTVSAAGTYTVTTTNTGGCTSSSSKSLTIKNVPGCNITGNGSVCNGNSTQWCAPAGLAAYLWSTGATTQCVTVNAAGTYTVTTTNTGGCTSSCSKTLTVNSLPSCSISGNSSVCQGKSTQWCSASTFSSYLWSTGATTKCINVSAAGTYTITVSNGSGCSSSCSQTLTVNPLPSATITGNGSVCSGFSTQWCAPAGLAGYLWSTGATTQCITVNTAGAYTVTTTNSNGCTKISSKTLVVNTNNVTITATGPTTYCDYDPNMMLCASAGVTYIWDTGETSQCVPANDKTHLYTVTVTDANGCVGTASQQVIENPLPDVSINAPAVPPICGLSGNTITGNTAGGNTYSWVVSSSDNSWVINGPATNSSVSYTAGNSGVCGEFFLTVTIPSTGCKKTASMVVCSDCEEHCGYDQVFYGSPTGVSCDGLTKTQILTNLLPNTLVNGDAARTVSILSSEVSCVIDKMPSKTVSGALPVGNVTCVTATGTAYLTNGQFKHALLGEAIALGLNVRLNPSLSNLVLSGPYMTTYKANNCTGGKAVNGTKLVFAIPQSVLNYLGANNSVGNLLLLANQALGATYIPSGSNPTIAEIDSAVKSINGGFNKCRILAGFGTSSAGVRSQDQLQQLQVDNVLRINAYPNPFNSSATIEFISDEKASRTTVDIYSLAGDKISNIFESDIEAGTIYKAEFNAKNLGEGIYIYRIISGDKIVNGKLILIK